MILVQRAHSIIVINTDKDFDAMQIIYVFLFMQVSSMSLRKHFKASYEVIFNDKRIV